ncbi:MAG TPA: TIGR01459 family HAD-type hydrolase, partial [Alphaproteobacteria bacterium]|nr:TIGR01459 family HAD-type hydrolase [Alphaproteobacteria bacterium]
WGLVHDGQTLYPGVAACLSALRAQGKRIIFLSNSPNRAHSVARKLAGLGVGAHMYDGIVTGGEVTHRLLREAADPQIRMFAKRFYDIDRTGLSGLLDGLPDRIRVEDLGQADALLATVVNSPVEEPLDGYDDILTAARARDLPLLCANPDRIVMVGTSLYYCPGAVADRYEALGGHVVRIGKPYPHVYDYALDLLGRPDPARVLAAGDSLATDVAGARQAGLPCLFNLTGIHRYEITCPQDNPAHPSPKPDPERLRGLLAAHPHRPDFMVAGLKW